MQIKSVVGEISFDEKVIIHIEGGLYGFEGLERFILADYQHQYDLFKWLVCVDEPDLAFIVVNPWVFVPDYRPEFPPEILSKLELESPKQAVVLGILTIPADLSMVSLNLKAPLLINVEKRKGRQIILDSAGYSIRHYIFSQLQDLLKKSKETAAVVR